MTHAKSSLTLFPSPNERYSVLLDLARTLTGSMSPAELYVGIRSQLARVLPMDAFTVALRGSDEGLEVVYRSGPPNGPVVLGTDDIEHLQEGDFLLRARGAGSELIVPLARETHLFGCMIAERVKGVPFDASDANFLLAVSQMSGVALDNARLFEDAHRRSEDAERLEAAARELSNSLELDTVVERTAGWAHALVKCPVVVWVVDDRRTRPVGAAGGGLFLPATEFELPGDWLAACARAANSGYIVELDAESTILPPGARDALGLGDERKSLLPLTLGERVVGFIVAGGEGGSASDDAMRLLRRMAPHAAAAVENARLHGEVRRLSLTDPLVQLPNRRQLDLYLKREFAAAQRGRPLTLVLFDLDRFKEYNDTNGHRAGDIALMKFGEILRTETRAMNLAARYGGEEFVAVLSETPAHPGGEGYAERIRRKLIEESEGQLSVSAGVAEYNRTMDTPVALIVAADRALYRAKTDGRNRVRVADGG